MLPIIVLTGHGNICRMFKNRDPEAAVLQQSMNPDLVLAALDERSEPDKLLEPQEKPRRTRTATNKNKQPGLQGTASGPSAAGIR